MRELLLSAMDDQQRARFDSLVKELGHLQGTRQEKLLAITDPTKLFANIAAVITSFFGQVELNLIPKTNLTPLAKIAADETRSIYIPSRESAKVYISGQPPAETFTKVLEATPDQFGIDTQDLPAGKESLIVIPLISSLAKQLPITDYPRHGALTAAKAVPNGFDPQVDLRILRAIGNNLAIALATHHLSL
jgi:hypothetical protein